jgi:hypothetical protein
MLIDMVESKLTEYKFQSIYKFLNNVYMNVEAGVISGTSMKNLLLKVL